MQQKITALKEKGCFGSPFWLFMGRQGTFADFADPSIAGQVSAEGKEFYFRIFSAKISGKTHTRPPCKICREEGSLDIILLSGLAGVTGIGDHSWATNYRAEPI